MKVIVVGCGRLGSALAYRLYKKGHHVTVTDQAAAAFDKLPSDFQGRVVQGDVLARDVLYRAGIEQADALAAVTSSDSTNAVVAHIARSVYHVPHVVVRNYAPHWQPLHEAFGLPTVGSTSWGAQRIEALLCNDSPHAVFSAGEVAVYEIVAPAAWHGRGLSEVLPEGQCRPVALTRAGRSRLPADNLRLETGDILHLGASPDGIEALRRQLSSTQEA